MINMHDIKKNAAVLVDGQPHWVVDFKRAGTGQRRPVLHVKLRHIVTGSLSEKTLSEKDVLDEPNLERTIATYSYKSANNYVFMDQKTFEQVEIPAEILGDRAEFLGEEVEVRLMHLDGVAIGVELPPAVTLEITECSDPQKGGTSSRTSSVGKSATLSNGLQIEVPLFMKKGERIRVNTETREYMGKEKE